MSAAGIAGVGIGLRRDLADCISEAPGTRPAFLELAPENWLGIGGFWRRKLDAALEQFPVTCHGLSLSLGSPEPLDHEFLRRLKRFFKQVPAALYSEHLSYCKCGNAHLYDLLPIPFRADAVRHVARRIRTVQDFLERPVAIENVSYYTPVAPELSESEFIRAVAEESGCLLLLDVNNVYVNAFNHGYDAKAFIESLPLERVACIHMAGHERKRADLIIDTHGRPIIDPVYELLEWTVARVAPVPILLERDYNFPQYGELQHELERLQSIADAAWKERRAA